MLDVLAHGRNRLLDRLHALGGQRRASGQRRHRAGPDDPAAGRLPRAPSASARHNDLDVIACPFHSFGSGLVARSRCVISFSRRPIVTTSPEK